MEHVIRGLGVMPKAARDKLVYLVVGTPVDYLAAVEGLAEELGVKQQLLLITEHLSEVRCCSCPCGCAAN